MLGLLGLRIFEATGADITTSARNTATGCCACTARATSRPHTPATSRRPSHRPRHRRPRTRVRSCATDAAPGWTATPPPDGYGTLADHAGVDYARMHPHMLRHTFVTTMLDAGVDLRDVQIAARHADPRTTMRYDRARKNLDRHPNYILAASWPPAPSKLGQRQIRTLARQVP